jgi:hypothetical protein
MLALFFVLASCDRDPGVEPPSPTAPATPTERSSSEPRDDAPGERRATVAAADKFTCALDRQQRVTCWGMFDGLSEPAHAREIERPWIRLPPLDGAVDLAAANLMVCGRFESGEVTCATRIPDERRFDSSVPVPGLTDAIQLSGGTNGLCALRRTGEAVCWTIDWNGNGGAIPSAPIAIYTDLGRVAEVAAGWSIRCVRLRSGAVHCGDGRSPSAEHAIDGAVSIGADRHACAVLEDGSLWCWGLNQFGQLGDGTSETRERPVRVQIPFEAASVVARGSNTCVLSRDAALHCWGGSRYGEAGDGARGQRRRPPAEPILRDVTSVDIGNEQLVARTRDGATHAWGWDIMGAVTGAPVRERAWTPVHELGDAIAVGVAGDHACALRRGGSVMCWGTIDPGDDLDSVLLDSDTPVAIEGFEGATALGVGLYGACAIVGGRVRCFGTRQGGLLGGAAGDPLGTAGAVEVPGIEGATALEVQHMAACAVVEGGLACWGEMMHGDFRSVAPRRIELAGAIEVELTSDFGCARRTGGAVWCFGGGIDAEMTAPSAFSGNRPRRRAQFIPPVDVPAFRGARWLAFDSERGCAGMPNRDVLCAEGAGPEPFVPRAVPGLREASRVTVSSATTPPPGVIAVERSNTNECAVIEDGRVLCRGDVRNGLLGDGSSDVVRRPRAVPIPD